MSRIRQKPNGNYEDNAHFCNFSYFSPCALSALCTLDRMPMIVPSFICAQNVLIFIVVGDITPKTLRPIPYLPLSKMTQIQRIQPDGNCLFRAISEALSLGTQGFKLLRTTAVNYIRSHRERFEAYNDTDSPWDEYIEKLSHDG